ncbi:hypothetical protein CRUP_034936 [Coryphaenoides rupestris]|nr:hypothetical protein CRUP_034936 [Coryphaenoides rupestris]
MLSSMRRHSLRLQHELHRWSLCDPGSSQPAPDRLVPRRVSRSKSCVSSTGESHGSSQESWSSSDSVISTDSAAGDPFRVVLLGGSHVGKTAFASIFAGAADSMDSEDCEMYGGEDCEMYGGEGCDDGGKCMAQDHQCMQPGDAYLLLYSITDRASFLRASELRITLRCHRPARHTPIILVGNKCDLVRRREVSVSAAMQHNVWEAFRGIVRQLRLRRDSKEANERRRNSGSRRRESLPVKAKRFLDKMVAKNNAHAAFRLKSKSCHDLSVF